MKTLEVCCYGVESADIAAKNGADRIELCSARSEGGLTPSYGELKLALQLNIPVYPILRPRGGDFCYTAYELEVMKADLVMIRSMGFQGVVFGALTADGDVDIAAMEALMGIAKPVGSTAGMDVTFHRAFDMSRDPFTSHESLKQLGVARILSSGMQATAVAGLPLLKELNALGGPIIMAGGGVRPDNIQLFIDAGLQE
ncbi:MAG: hypothetical protein LBV04_04490, partial [Deferribacteraceae bacterium]|nr:hypothetical protein [Deferribacteraceae bacterium]